jgi:hypothetical protein
MTLKTFGDDLTKILLSLESRITKIEDFINKHDFSALKCQNEKVISPDTNSNLVSSDSNKEQE